MTTTQTLTRPASWQEWQERTQLVAPKLAESMERGLAYQPQPSDLFISPYAKCGTTWVQQISISKPWLATAKCNGDEGQDGPGGRSSQRTARRDRRGNGCHLARGCRAADRIALVPGIAGGLGLM
jgi:hypothetical protein